jgi:MoaA/NifB/PqqE/SkfB family radical SAM enzyme
MERDSRRLESVRRGGLLFGPEILQVNLGHRCNLDCIFCWNHSPLLPRRSKAWHGAILSDRHARNVAEAIPVLRPDRVVLSGQGEPLIQKAAPVILHAALDAGIPVVVQTNGVGGIDVERLEGVERLMVNLSAATPDGYEATHPGCGGLLPRVVGRMRQAAVLRSRGKGPEVTILAVVQRTNIDELVPIVELAREVGASAVHFKGMEFAPGLETLVLDAEDRERVRRGLELAKECALRLGVSLHSAHLEQVLGCSDGRRFTDCMTSVPCVMGWYYLRVTCDGRVMFCCKDKLVGHLDDRPLSRIWRSPTYHLHRLAARDGDGSTGLLDEKCRACSNFERNRQVVLELESTS